MQLTIGRRWILEIRINVALRERVTGACKSVRSAVTNRTRQQDAALRWERDRFRGTMLSSWDRMIPPRN